MGLKIGILTTSIRENRQSINVANWVLDFASKRNDGNTYEVVDLKDYKLPVFGATPTEAEGLALKAWSEKMSELDGYIIITAEYNHTVPAVFKNATEFLKPEVANKALGFVGYGGLGGIRAITGLRIMFGELAVAMVQRTVNFLLAVDFENFSVFKPLEHHEAPLNEMLDQLTSWAGALKTIR